jgi:hypothetical protein
MLKRSLLAACHECRQLSTLEPTDPPPGTFCVARFLGKICEGADQRSEMLQVTGNAMSVPVVGAVFLAALRCLTTAAQAQSLPRVQFGFNARAAMMQRIAKKIMEVDAQRCRYEESLALLDQLR